MAPMPHRTPPLKDNTDPPVWLTVLKLSLGAALLMGCVWLVLNYVTDRVEANKMKEPAKLNLPSWGIFSDNPVRNKR